MKDLTSALGAALLCLASAGALLAQEGELWVAVGDSGRRLSSRDGERWEHDQSWERQKGDLDDVAFGLGHFVAVGGNKTSGIIVQSSDGVQWTEQAQGGRAVECIAFGRDRFIAAQGTQLLVSTNGQTFGPGAKIEVPDLGQLPATDVARDFAEGLSQPGHLAPHRIACGDTEAGFRFVVIGRVDYTAADGSGTYHGAWRAVVGDGTRVEHFAPATDAEDIAYGAGHFVAVGLEMIETSHDGQTWVKQSFPEADLHSIQWTGTRFIAKDSTDTWTSHDALTWRKLPGSPMPHLYWARDSPAPIYLGWRWEDRTMPFFSRDLDTWKLLTPKVQPALHAIAHRPATP